MAALLSVRLVPVPEPWDPWTSLASFSKQTSAAQAGARGAEGGETGAVASFIGLVRAQDEPDTAEAPAAAAAAEKDPVAFLTLEHYPGATERAPRETRRRGRNALAPDRSLGGAPHGALGSGRADRARSGGLGPPRPGPRRLHLPHRAPQNRGTLLEAGGARQRRPTLALTSRARPFGLKQGSSSRTGPHLHLNRARRGAKTAPPHFHKKSTSSRLHAPRYTLNRMWSTSPSCTA